VTTPEGTAPDATAPDGRAATRTPAVVASELADVERYLREVPPHQSGGRDALERRRATLQRELRAARRGEGAGGR
jgi:hypothetical protein